MNRQSFIPSSSIDSRQPIQTYFHASTNDSTVRVKPDLIHNPHGSSPRLSLLPHSTPLSSTPINTLMKSGLSRPQHQKFIRIPPSSTLAKPRKSLPQRKRHADEEEEHIQEVTKRFRNAIDRDTKLTRSVDTSAFKSLDDFLHRLMPFHVWQLHDPDVDNYPDDLPRSEDLVAAGQTVMKKYDSLVSRPYTERPEIKKPLGYLIQQLLNEPNPHPHPQRQS